MKNPVETPQVPLSVVFPIVVALVAPIVTW